MTPILRSLAATYPAGFVLDAHAHTWGQLVYAAAGAISVTIEGVDWLVPPARAVWLAPNVEHRLGMQAASSLRTLYLAPKLAAEVAGAGFGLEVCPLLRELILHLVKLAPLNAEVQANVTLTALLIDLMREAQLTPFRLKPPQDARALRASRLIRSDPGANLSLAALADVGGTTVRTLQRLFVAETGLRLSEWRQAARLQHAATLLAEGSSVTDAGLACGYATTSAFILAFRRRTGRTPLAYRTSAKGGSLRAN